MVNRIKLFVIFIVIVSLFSCNEQGTKDMKRVEGLQRTISFSGFEWTAEGSGPDRISPGQNYFSGSDENVWVDKRGNLHLKITKRNGNWYCAQVTMKESYGFNRYVFYVFSRVDRFDKNVVGGLFTYLDDSNEIDIEFARWGTEGNSNAQFAVQPAHHDGNIFRYHLGLKDKKSTHVIDWKADTINFASYPGHHSFPTSKRKLMSEWSYSGNYIPAEGEEKVIINLWLYNGLPPSDNREAEIVIRAVEIL